MRAAIGYDPKSYHSFLLISQQQFGAGADPLLLLRQILAPTELPKRKQFEAKTGISVHFARPRMTFFSVARPLLAKHAYF
jgi:hypothetical protein